MCYWYHIYYDPLYRAGLVLGPSTMVPCTWYHNIIWYRYSQSWYQPVRSQYCSTTSTFTTTCTRTQLCEYSTCYHVPAM